MTVHSTKELPKTYSLNTCLGELMRDPKAQAVMEPIHAGNGTEQCGSGYGRSTGK